MFEANFLKGYIKDLTKDQLIKLYFDLKELTGIVGKELEEKHNHILKK